MSVADDLFESIKAEAAKHGFQVTRRHDKVHGWVFILTDGPKESGPPALGVSVEDQIETIDRMG